MLKLLRLEFIPASADVALLLLRVWLGLSMLVLHGWGKFMKLLGGDLSFGDPLGLGAVPSFLLVVFAEVFCSVLLVLGACTRLAAFALAFTMGVAFFMVHKMQLTGEKNGELAFVFLAGYLVLLIAGAGRHSMDGK